MSGLQIKTTGRAEYGTYCKMLVYGEPGSRKTLFGSTAPKPFYLNLEAGLMTIADRGIPYVDIEQVEDLKEVLLFLRNKSEHDYQTVIIDTIDEMQRVFIADRLRKERRESMQLQDWGYVGEQMQKALRAYRNLPMNVILLCHSKTDQDNESGVLMWKPALQGAIADQIAGYVDLASHISVTPVRTNEKMEDKVTLRFQSGPRFPHIKDRSGKMPPFYELNLETDFADILEKIFSDAGNMAEGEVVGQVETGFGPTAELPAPPTAANSGPARAANNPSNAKGRKAKEKPVEETPVTPFEPPSVRNVTVTKIEDAPTLEEALETVKETLGAQVIQVIEHPKCSVCEEPVSDEDTLDLGKIRFNAVLCKPHLKERIDTEKKSRG